MELSLTSAPTIQLTPPQNFAISNENPQFLFSQLSLFPVYPIRIIIQSSSSFFETQAMLYLPPNSKRFVGDQFIGRLHLYPQSFVKISFNTTHKYWVRDKKTTTLWWEELCLSHASRHVPYDKIQRWNPFESNRLGNPCDRSTPIIERDPCRCSQFFNIILYGLFFKFWLESP